MSYNVKNTAGATVAVVPDRHIDRDSTSLSLVGFNVTNYGLEHAENFVQLLENFAAATAPANPIPGQIWYDSVLQKLKCYNGTAWMIAGAGGIDSVSGDPTEGGLGGIYHLYIGALDTSALLFFAGGKIVMVVSSIDIPQANLPANVTVGEAQYALQSRFPHGVDAGTTLARDAADYIFSGKVKRGHQADFAGGSNVANVNKPAGWAYIDIGANTVALMLSNGQIICAVSQVVIAAGSLPISISLEVMSENPDGSRAEATVSMPFRANFTGGLSAGFTFSSGMSLGGFVTASVVASMISDEATARAAAIESLRVWVDASSATAMKMLTLETKFTTAAGTSSFASAIDYVLAQSTDTGAVTAAITSLKTEFTNALGVSTWSDALTKLSASSNASAANSAAITELKSAFQNTTGSSNIATAVQTLWTEATATGSSAGWGVTLNSNGYVTGVEQFNGGASNNFFKVTASRFYIADGNIEFIPFEVRNGTVYIKNAVIEDLTIGATKITPNSLSVPVIVHGTDQFVSSPVGNITTVMTTGNIVVGDNFGGNALCVFLGEIDTASFVDVGMRAFLDIDTGSGFVQVAQIQLGVRTNNGDTYFKMPIVMTHAVTNVTSIAYRLRATPYTLPSGGTPSPSSYLRNPRFMIFGAKR